MICEWQAVDMRVGGMRKYGKAVNIESWVTNMVTAVSHFSEHLEETRGEVVFEKGIHNNRHCVNMGLEIFGYRVWQEVGDWN